MVAIVSAPADWLENVSNLTWPPRFDRRLQDLMDRNNEGRLSPEERVEMAELVDLSERLSLVRADALLLLGRAPK